MRARQIYAWLLYVLVMAFLTPITVSYAEIADVWALSDGTKVKRDETSHKLKNKNGVFDRSLPLISLFGVRNETVAFQAILQGGRSRTIGIKIRLNSVGPINNSGVTQNMDSYYVGRNICILKEHYLHITTRSHDLAWAPGTAAVPDMSGWVPDALIPLGPNDSFSVEAGQNQGVWVDIFIPSDTPPGFYRGTLVVDEAGVPCSLLTCQIPVRLEVLGATLPNSATAKTMLYFSSPEDDANQWMSRYLEDPWSPTRKELQALTMRHFKLGRRHRVTMFITGRNSPAEDDLGEANLLLRLNGSAFSMTSGYWGPGVGVGQDMYSIWTFGGSLNSSQARAWADWFARRAPAVEYFLYTWDEPGRDDFKSINRIAATAEPVPSFVTHEPHPGLDVDIFCAFPEAYSISEAAAYKAKGKRVWIYNGMRPFTGTFMIDDVAVSPRVNPLIQYKYGIMRWFYWESTYYHDEQGSGDQINIFVNPINFTNHWGDEMNGDGLLIYPGRDRLFTAHDQGFNGPMPSIRLKNWRRGIETVEYLVLAKAAGHQSLVNNVLATLVPLALDEGNLKNDDPVAWEENGEVWLAQRRLLADALGSSTSDSVVFDGLDNNNLVD